MLGTEEKRAWNIKHAFGIVVFISCNHQFDMKTEDNILKIPHEDMI